MKKLVIIVIAVVMGFNTQSFSQIQNIRSSDDSTLVIDTVYAGVLSSVNLNTNELTSTSSYSFRIGAMATWHATKWADVKTYGMYNRSNGKDLIVNSFSINLHKEQWNIEFGKMATPATEIRPLPPSSNRHFETWT
jgi:hypothetical protein